jgi:hypothetical protein
VFAVDPQRSGDSDRDLGRADEVLDVPGEQGGVDGVVAHVGQLGAGVLLDHVGALGSHLARVVVAAVAGDLERAPTMVGRHVILHCGCDRLT